METYVKMLMKWKALAQVVETPFGDLKEARNPRRTCKKFFSEPSQRFLLFAPVETGQIGLDVSTWSSTIQSRT